MSDENEDDKAAVEVQPGTLKEDAPEIDPDLPETEDEEEEDFDPLEVVLSIAYVKQLVDIIRERGHEQLADAFLAVEVGEFITIHIEV